MNPFLTGDRVRLTDKAAKTANTGFSNMRRHSPVDWRMREGVVHSGNKNDVSIMWDGRATLDQWPVRALEKIEKGGTSRGAEC
jgi:hypothetical protein